MSKGFIVDDPVDFVKNELLAIEIPDEIDVSIHCCPLEEFIENDSMEAHIDCEEEILDFLGQTGCDNEISDLITAISYIEDYISDFLYQNEEDQKEAALNSGALITEIYDFEKPTAWTAYGPWGHIQCGILYGCISTCHICKKIL